MLKIILVKNFCVVKFSQFVLIREIFLAVDYCNSDERLESSGRLVYYQVSETQGSLTVVVDWTFTLWSAGLARISLFIDRCHVSLIFAC